MVDVLQLYAKSNIRIKLNFICKMNIIRVRLQNRIHNIRFQVLDFETQHIYITDYADNFGTMKLSSAYRTFD